MYTSYLVITDEVTEADRDEYLRLFSHRRAAADEAARWLQQWMRKTKMKQPDIEELPSFAEMFKKTLDAMPIEELLDGRAPEQVLSAFAPEERLAGLAPEQVILALPVDVLRVLPEDYLRSLPAEVQEQIKKRLQGSAH